MRQIGDRRLRWRRTPRFAEYVGAATWQQRTTLFAAFVGGLTCVYLVVHLLGLEFRVPGLDAPASTPAFVAAPRAQRHPLVVHVPVAVLAERPSARRTHERKQPVTRSRHATAPEAVAPSAAAPPSTEAPAPEPPPADAPAPPPQEPAAPVQPPPVVEAATAALAPVPSLPPLPELGVPSVELPPVPPVALPAFP
jgi:hypothetical protein